MDPIEALKQLRVFINAASESDDIDAIHLVLREMRRLVNNALPPVRRTKKKEPKPGAKRPSLKVLK
jgi:hypothetical protein